MQLKHLKTGLMLVGGVAVANAAANVALTVIEKSGGGIAGILLMAQDTMTSLMVPVTTRLEYSQEPSLARMRRAAAMTNADATSTHRPTWGRL